jgi:hypothetical protein
MELSQASSSSGVSPDLPRIMPKKQADVPAPVSKKDDTVQLSKITKHIQPPKANPLDPKIGTIDAKKVMFKNAEDQQQVDLAKGQIKKDQLESYQANTDETSDDDDASSANVVVIKEPEAGIDNDINAVVVDAKEVMFKTAEDEQQVELASGQLQKDQMENYQESYQAATSETDEEDETTVKLPDPNKMNLYDKVAQAYSEEVSNSTSLLG